MIVENDHDTREMYAEWLAFSGFRVVQAETVDDALLKARKLRPSVITTDIGLPGGRDGCELCAALKHDDRTRAIPVVAVTAWAMGGHIERVRRAGCDSVLVKPVLPAALLDEIVRLLNLRKQGASTPK